MRRPVAATLAIPAPAIGDARMDSGMPWWIAPLAVVAAIAGLGLQLLLGYLWVIAKSNLH